MNQRRSRDRCRPPCGPTSRGALAIAIFLGALPAAGTPPPVPLERDFLIRSWRREHGLPDDRVLALLPARSGYLWLGTRKGVSRFDGSRFVTWSRSTHAAFSHDECRALTEDRDGVIWAGTWGGGVVQFTEPPVRYDPERLERHFAAGNLALLNQTRSLGSTDAGELLAGTPVGLVTRAPDASWTHEDTADTVEFCPITGFATSPDRVVWMGTVHQLFRRDHPGSTWVKALDGDNNRHTRCVHGLAVTTDGVLHALVGSWPNGTGRVLRREAEGWRTLLDRELRNFSQPLFLAADGDGGLWFPITGQVVGRWHAGRLTEYTLPPGLGADVFLCLAPDAEGNLWAGTSRSGLFCLQPRRIRTLTTSDGLPNPETWTLLEAADGALWVGTQEGVIRFNREGAASFSGASPIWPGRIRALAEDLEGRVWIGTGAGLFRWNGRKVERLEYPGEPHRYKIRTLHAGRDGAIWAGTAQGLYRFRPAETDAWQVADGLPHENVCVVLEDRAGQVWIGTDGGGLARLTRTGFERFDESRGLSSLRVWALHEDADGTLWIGTDRGLNLLRHGRVTVLTTANGLPENLVNGVITDLHGGVWVGHDRGIYRACRRELVEAAEGRRAWVHCVTYTEQDGLPHTETNGQISYPPVIRLADRRVAFATVAGVALFDPGAPPDVTNGPPAQIESLRAGGMPLFPSTAEGRDVSIAPPGGLGTTRPPFEPNPLTPSLSRRTGEGARRAGEGNHGGSWSRAAPTGSASERPAVRIRPRQRRLVDLQYTAISFRLPDQTRFRYRLLGLSPDWVDAGTLRQAAYADLRPGAYTFEVMAANHHGHWSSAPARLDLVVEPVWHERLAIRLAGALSLVAVAAGAARWRLQQLRRVAQLEQQAALARHRARLAKDLHDGLGASLTEMTLLSGVGEPAALPPEVITRRFNQLTQATHQALHSLRDIIWSTTPKADSLEALVSRICASTERATEAAGLRCRFDFPPELPAVALGPELRKDLLFAVNELVHNTVRHARAAEVHVRFRIEKGRFEIEIQDDGQGFNLAEAGQRVTAPDRGLGLASVRERLAAQGGVCELRSQAGQGTNVTLRLPLLG